MTDVPHFSYPFRFVGVPPRAAEAEQDSLDEIADCVVAVVLTNPGERLEEPEFGLVDPTFRDMPLTELSSAVARWEPRAATVVEDGWDYDEFIRKIQIKIREEPGG